MNEHDEEPHAEEHPAKAPPDEEGHDVATCDVQMCALCVHNVAACLEPMCEWCDGHSHGYADGKTKMAAEIVERATGRGHATYCACVPCKTVRLVVEVGRDALETETLVANAHHLEGCGCRPCAMLRALWALSAPLEHLDDDGPDDDDEMATADRGS